MRIAIPVKQGEFSLHFSNCDQFAIIDVKVSSKQILNAQYLTPSSFDLNILLQWIRENKVDLIIAGGMPQQVQGLLVQNHIDFQVGILYGSIKAIISAFLDSQESEGTTEVIRP